MKNYKINMNRKPLTDADLSSKGDFNALLKSYKAAKTPFFKAPKFWFGTSAVLVASVTTVVVYMQLFMSAGAATSTIPSFIQPPIAGADIKPNTYIIDAGKDSNLTYTTGSKIHIPANAFTDDNGQPVSGKVELHYREFHKVSDVFLAGIPMTYDSAGEQFHFETAGMIEIAATQNGKPLKTNPDALIMVDLASANREDRFNTYYLDTVEKKWKYLAQKNYNEPAPETENDATPASSPYSKQLLAADAPAQQVIKQLDVTQKEIARIEMQKPVEPKKVNKDKHRFKISVDEKEFPEISVYSNMKFEVADKNYNPEKAKILWENVELKRITGRADYEVIFSNAKETYTVIATPVFEDKDIKEATRVYEEKYKEYEAKLGKKKADEVRLKAELETRAKAIEEKIRKEIAEQAERRKTYEARLAQSDLIFRTFQIADFGIWNCDNPNRLPPGVVVVAQLKDANTKENLKIQTCYLVEKGRNAIFTYYPDRLHQFRFNPAKENMVWVVTSDLKVAIIKPEQFSATQRTNGIMPLELTVIDKKFTSTEEVKAYLDI